VSGETKPHGTVAIVTRTKDRTILLRRCIETVLDQTSPDWVHMIVNDGGEPGPVDALLAPYRNRYGDRLCVIHNPVSVGMEAAANVGVRASSSRYVVVLDDDDAWDARFLEKCVAALQAETWPVVRGIICHTDIVYEKIEGTNVRKLRQFDYNKWMVAVELPAMLAWNRFTPVSFLFERGVFEEIGYFDEELSVCGDWDFSIRFLLKYEIAVLPETLAYWHQRPDPKSAFGNSVKSKADLHRVVRARMVNRWIRRSFATGEWSLGNAFVTAAAAEYSRVVHDSWWRMKQNPALRALAKVNRSMRAAVGLQDVE
jgi:GT2 family glycosyltransferase